MNLRKLLLLVFFIILQLSLAAAKAGSSQDRVLIEELVFKGSQSVLPDGTGLRVQGDGLTLDDGHHHGEYTSPIIDAPFSFNAVVPQWFAELPEFTSIKIYLRTGQDGRVWDDWQEVQPSSDWTLDDDEEIIGDMLVVSAMDGTHSLVQFRAVIDNYAGVAKPILDELRLVFIDSTAGPTTEEMLAQQQGVQQNTTVADGYPKPPVISRDIWCTDPRCDYTDGLEYHSVTHLILHHTVTSSSGDSAATVRAIWAFHTDTRGWGDIGYNFLIDTAGIIFEGHLGGDDVVGTHAGNANTGSMAAALIGDFSYQDPPQPMIDSAVELFSWKADQRNIDVFDASAALPNVAWGLPHMMGHRDVFGTTQCPGDHAHSLLPAIRDQVAEKVGLVSPYQYVDELSGAFIRSNANWYTPIYQCGHNTHAWYTWSTTDPSQAVNWGEWRPEISADGRYRIDAHIPYCNTGRSETAGAVYTITHAGETTEVTADQNQNVGLWMTLGEFDLHAGNSNVIHLSDLTTTDDGLGIWFDSLRLLQVQAIPAATNQMPDDGSWLNDRQVAFEWYIANPEEVAATEFQIATDDQFQNIISSKEWPSAVESVPHTFNKDYGALFWRVILTAKSGGEYASTTTRFGIDSEPPVSQISSLAWLAWIQRYRLTWQGQDNLTGLATYTIEYRPVGQEPWIPLLKDADQISVLFAPDDTNLTYEFRSQAVDQIGNTEPVHETADIDTQQASFYSHAIILPVIRTEE
ncbi:MAG: N-acetylmuramoyl-L-alanine amidase [Candidatus Promineifilaceae bacterium]|nr:N-acetylmuramoyl-L-alanine amidase [Candidatus Promineifilaceae bacterium]